MRYLVKSTLVSLGGGNYAEAGQWIEMDVADAAHLAANGAIVSEADAQAQAAAAVTGQDPEKAALRERVAQLEADLAAANEALQDAGAELARLRDEDPEDVRMSELLKLSKEELVAAATEKGLDASGTKADLASRIVDAEYPQE